MRISATAFEDGGNIPAKYTCDGENISPPLRFSDVPAAAKSLALIVEDPDAPRGTFVHWIVWGMAPNTRESAEDRVPGEALEIENGFGREGYGGPCPPSGMHRYYFRLFALDTNDLPPPDARQFHQAVSGHILEEAILMGRYQRAAAK
jgi:Raf kinase inhibitor-like YbhB/YbcL family protein